VVRNPRALGISGCRNLVGKCRGLSGFRRRRQPRLGFINHRLIAGVGANRIESPMARLWPGSSETIFSIRVIALAAAVQSHRHSAAAPCSRALPPCGLARTELPRTGRAVRRSRRRGTPHGAYCMTKARKPGCSRNGSHTGSRRSWPVESGPGRDIRISSSLIASSWSPTIV
jgi:hypothetical protein